ncbi:MAG: glycoside hydrolase family protein [Pseudobutyrivibrio sp.]|nr:glycoside hydrolase family protein [Pseudobutyrivibrio sp.]
MKTSNKGIDLIKKYEGLRLTAYKPVSTEKYYTIGYGHYGPDVTAGMTISKEKAVEFLKQDLAKFEKAVNAIELEFNQNQFDALVSFAYNCGAGNLKSLCKGRTIEQIGNKLPAYNKAGGKVLNGLVKRRAEEQKLYKTPVGQNQNEKKEEPVQSAPVENTEKKEEKEQEVPFVVKVEIDNLNIRKGPGTNYARINKFTGVGAFTIVKVSEGKGSKTGWGKLRSGLGWVSLDYCKRI